LVWASDKNKVATDGGLHTNFKISSSGEALTLKDPDGNVIDILVTINLWMTKPMEEKPTVPLNWCC